MNKFGLKLEEMGNPHICCTDHVLNLTAKLAFNGGNFAEFEALALKKFQKLVGFFNSSTQATERLKDLQATLADCKGKPKSVITEVVTCWWATHAMIERLLDLKPALDFMANENKFDKMFPLEESEWEALVHIMDVLKPFKDAQSLLEGQKHVTAGFVLQAIAHIRKMLQKKANDPRDTGAKTLAARMLKDFETCWGKDTNPVWNDSVRRGD